MLPFEFVVEGTPISLQTNNAPAKLRWKEKVFIEAGASWVADDPPTENKVQVTIWHFYKNMTFSDIDNILKPIIDALKGLVYLDDNQVTDVIGRKRNIYEKFILEEGSPIITERLTKQIQFVYVKVEFAPDPRRLS